MGEREEHFDGIQSKVFGVIHTLNNLLNPPPSASNMHDNGVGNLGSVQRIRDNAVGSMAWR